MTLDWSLINGENGRTASQNSSSDGIEHKEHEIEKKREKLSFGALQVRQRHAEVAARHLELADDAALARRDRHLELLLQALSLPLRRPCSAGTSSDTSAASVTERCSACALTRSSSPRSSVDSLPDMVLPLRPSSSAISERVRVRRLLSCEQTRADERALRLGDRREVDGGPAERRPRRVLVHGLAGPCRRTVAQRVSSLLGCVR